MNKKNTPKNTKAKKADKISDVKNELKESKEKYLRLYSEFENYRRRTSKEKLEMIEVSNQELIKDILPVIDDFERALKAIKSKQKDDFEGFNLISQKLNNILGKYNLIKMEVNKEDVFDLEFHEAITNTPASKKLKGKIVDIIEEGYLIGEKIIRHAKVVIGS
jgi:molecular chaperone GrpE|tara:strand:- start:212 stop:700 length:489 start_codon:yes stop_codon:yes gene_type:complete